jgi:hypothetical protein
MYQGEETFVDIPKIVMMKVTKKVHTASRSLEHFVFVRACTFTPCPPDVQAMVTIISYSYINIPS